MGAVQLRAHGAQGLTVRSRRGVPPKGLGAIRTLSQVRVGAPGTAARATTARSWVFVPRPRFERYQGDVLVEPVAVPSVEVLDESHAVVVLADLRGARDEEIRMAIYDDVIAIWTEPAPPSTVGRYECEVLLPFVVLPAPRRRSFRHGLLEVELARDPDAGGPASNGGAEE